jgi:predicted ATP-dependent endonuclease of OLD family
MITSIQFENFRGFTDLSISPLKQINLITGANNTGKTGILEGLFLLFNSNQPLWPIHALPGIFRSSLAGMPNQFNQDDYTTFWESLFHDRQTNIEPKITARSDRNSSFYCKLKFLNSGIQILEEEIRDEQKGQLTTVVRPGVHPQPAQQPFTWNVNINGQVGGSGRPNPFAQEFIILSTRLEHPTQDADLFNQVTLLEGGEEKLLNLLQQVDPRLQKLRYAKAPRMSQALVYAHFGMKNAISITQTGQGFSKLFSLFCRMLLSKAKIVFIDEIENGLYYETLPEIWKGIETLAKSENIQIFATTHSRECILAAHETMKMTPNYDFALHRLQRVKGKIESITHDKEMLEASVKTGLEVR